MPEDFYLSQLNGVSWTWRRQCRHKSLLLRKTHGDGIAGSIASDGYRVGKACGQSGRSRAVGTCPARYGYCLSAGDVHHGIHGCRHRSGRTDGGAFGGVDALYGSRNGYRPGRKPYHRRRQRTALQPVRVRLSGRAYRLVRQTAPFFRSAAKIRCMLPDASGSYWNTRVSVSCRWCATTFVSPCGAALGRIMTWLSMRHPGRRPG